MNDLKPYLWQWHYKWKPMTILQIVSANLKFRYVTILLKKLVKENKKNIYILNVIGHVSPVFLLKLSD